VNNTAEEVVKKNHLCEFRRWMTKGNAYQVGLLIEVRNRTGPAIRSDVEAGRGVRRRGKVESARRLGQVGHKGRDEFRDASRQKATGRSEVCRLLSYFWQLKERNAVKRNGVEWGAKRGKFKNGNVHRSLGTSGLFWTEKVGQGVGGE